MFSLIELLFKDPVSYAIIMMAVVFGLTIHEYFHGWVAYMLGDDTAKLAGRLTVNPVAHFDPVMTSMIFLVGLGAAKPVPINPNRLKHGNIGIFLVSIAGITANFISAFVFAFVFQAMVNNGQLDTSSLVFLLLQQLVLMNLSLMIFNLLPLPPLDGSKVLLSLIPEQYQNIYNYFSHNQVFSLIMAMMLFSIFGHQLMSFFLNIIQSILGLFF